MEKNNLKNVHLLPTDNLSKLYKENGEFYFEEYPLETVNAGNQHIYITNDEKNKVGNWFLPKGHINPHKLKGFNKINGDLESYNGLCYDISKCKKIILTDNKDLIKDGVQAINDEFLQWFVKNPSCEYVKWNAYPISPNGNIVGTDRPYPFDGLISNFRIEYSIIIPKEEPKQETPEEVIKTYCKNKYGEGYYPDVEKAIEFGAKWQQERDKNKYSEEECYRILHKLMMEIHLSGLVINDDMDLKKWFEQFKKK
jgi:hypothetical protein